MKDFIKINENDNVIVALKELTAGETILAGTQEVTARETIPAGTQDGNPRYCDRSRGD